MQKPPADRPNRESRRFIVALVAALVAHVLLFAGWNVLPLARAEPLSAQEQELATAQPIAVQFVAPPPPPEPDVTPVEAEPVPIPAPEPPPEPEPITEAPFPEQVMTALEEPKPEEPVVEEPVEPVETPVEPPEPVATPAPTPLPEKKVTPVPPKPRPDPKPRAVSRPSPPRTSISSRPTPSASSAPPTLPSYRSNPKPSYPSEAKRAGIEGTTYLKVEILSSGRVGSVTVSRSSGSRILDEAAAHTVRTRWRFRAGTRGGSPVTSSVTIPIRFDLR